MLGQSGRGFVAMRSMAMSFVGVDRVEARSGADARRARCPKTTSCGGGRHDWASIPTTDEAAANPRDWDEKESATARPSMGDGLTILIPRLLRAGFALVAAAVDEEHGPEEGHRGGADDGQLDRSRGPAHGNWTPGRSGRHSHGKPILPEADDEFQKVSTPSHEESLFYAIYVATPRCLRPSWQAIRVGAGSR